MRAQCLPTSLLESRKRVYIFRLWPLLIVDRHALGNRARKAGQGILTVRFEMPYAIWCTTCPKPTIIGQGVRFNAEKKKVGNYHSTPIFSFRMKHNVCGGWIEIRTDPKNTAYVVTDGAKKRDTGEDKQIDGEIRIRTDEERERLHNDAFAALEVKIDDRKQLVNDKSRIEEIQHSKDKDWDDPYAASKKLRRVFRADRKARQKNEALTEDLKDRMSLGMDLLDETEEDRKRASFIDFGDFDGETAIAKAKSKPLFAETSTKTKPKNTPSKLKSVSEADLRKEKLRREIGNNTRAILDPFLKTDKEALPNTSSSTTTTIISAIKRLDPSASKSTGVPNPPNTKHGTSKALVDYDSE